jgi:hypothetical protein
MCGSAYYPDQPVLDDEAIIWDPIVKREMPCRHKLQRRQPE